MPVTTFTIERAELGPDPNTCASDNCTSTLHLMSRVIRYQLKNGSQMPEEVHIREPWQMEHNATQHKKYVSARSFSPVTQTVRA